LGIIVNLEAGGLFLLAVKVPNFGLICQLHRVGIPPLKLFGQYGQLVQRNIVLRERLIRGHKVVLPIGNTELARILEIGFRVHHIIVCDAHQTVVDELSLPD